MAARLHPRLRLHTAPWEGAQLTPSNRRMREILDELTPAGLARSVTVHEAGHAVVGLATGHRITRMQTTDNGLNHGQTSYEGGRAVPVVDHLAMIVAGLQAQLRWLSAIGASRQVRDYADRQASGDMDYFREAAKTGGAPRSALRDAQRRADQLLARHWRGVEALAYELDVRRTLDSGTVRRLSGV